MKPLSDLNHGPMDANWMNCSVSACVSLLVGVGILGLCMSPTRGRWLPSESADPVPLKLLQVQLTGSNAAESKTQPGSTTTSLPRVPPPPLMEKPDLSTPDKVPLANLPVTPTLTPAPILQASPVPAHKKTEHTAASAAPLSTTTGQVAPSIQDISDTPAPASPVWTPLTFGVGTGRQPHPRYPLAAVREGQEGRITAAFIVGENGRVESVDLIHPCPWPLLNAEAVRVIKRDWRFPMGIKRFYRISIHFQLNP